MLNNAFQLPKDGIAGLRQYWRSDTFSAFLVFLISLPFCLSVAFASHLPIFSGLITAIVGGVLITFISGSHLTIKIPSLGLISVILLAVHSLGSGYLSTGYPFTLALIVAAGVLQILLALLRVGDWLNIIPESVVYGILAMIGISVIVHQIYYLLGLNPNSFDTLSLIIDFPFNILKINTSIAFIGILSLFILFSLSSIKSQFLPIIPTPMFVVFIGVILGYYFSLRNTPEQNQLLQIPNSWSELITFPDFSRLITWQSINYVITIAILSSLETILNIKSIDAIDFYRRKTNINRELFAIGLGNVISGSLGGLPMVSSLEDSSANVNSRAKTRWSSFFYGLLLLIFLLLIIRIFRRVPVACLSALLIYQAYKLCSPKLFKDILYIGREQLIIFLVTLIAALFTGILLGIIIGFISSLVIFLVMGASFRSLFISNIKVVNFGNNRNKVMIKNEALASNYYSLKRQLDKIPDGSQIYLDFSKSRIIDYSFMELIYHHPYNYNTEEGSIELQGFEEHYPLSEHPLATRVMRKNPTNLDNITLFSERQVEVLGVASINNAKLRAGLTYDGNKLQGFKFALGYEIKYRENKFTKNYKSRKYNHLTKIEFSDIFLSKGIRLSEQSHLISVLLVNNIRTYVPTFTLNQEGIFAKFLQTIGYDDIDFEDYPSFSQHYFLRGVNSKEIREFFTPTLIEFLEENQEFNIESSDNKILIYKDMDLLNRIEIEDAMDFAEEFLKIIYQEETPPLETTELMKVT